MPPPGARSARNAAEPLLDDPAHELEAEPARPSLPARRRRRRGAASAARRSARTTIGGAPCWNAFVTSSFATMPSFCAVAASNVDRRRLDRDRHRRALRRCCAGARPRRRSPRLSVSRRCTVAIERMRAAVSSNARPVAAVRAAEQEQVGHCLEVVLDPVVRLLRERALELGARRGRSCAAASRRIVRASTSATATAAATSASRIAVAPAEQRDEASRRRAGRRADGEPEACGASRIWTTAMNGNGEEQEQREVRAAGDDEQRDEPDQPARPEIEQERPRRDLRATPATARPSRPCWRRRRQRQADEQPAMAAPTSSASPATTATIETQPSQKPAWTTAVRKPSSDAVSESEGKATRICERMTPTPDNPALVTPTRRETSERPVLVPAARVKTEVKVTAQMYATDPAIGLRTP